MMNFLYAATDNGILKADKTGSNLLDYHNWSRIEDIPHASKKFNHLKIHAGKLIANYTPDQWYEDEMYAYDGVSWEPYLPQIKYAFDMQNSGDYLTIASRDQVFVIDNNDQIIQSVNLYQQGSETISPIHPRSASIYSDGTIWIADYEESLVKVSGDNYETGFVIGPLDNTIYSLNYSSSGLWVTPGGTRGYEIPRFERLENNQWKYFT